MLSLKVLIFLMSLIEAPLLIIMLDVIPLFEVFSLLSALELKWLMSGRSDFTRDMMIVLDSFSYLLLRRRKFEAVE